jgi:branched-chain amino acid transport system substrate-binding protein
MMTRLLAAAAALLLIAAPSAPLRASDPPEVTVGAILPLTGTFAQTGQGLKAAMELARDVINGGVSRPITMAGSSGLPRLGHAKLKIIFADSQGKPDQARTVAEQLITQDHVVALLGCYTSATTQTASALAERYGIPFLNPDSSNPQLTERGFKWFFRTTPHDGTIVQNLFDFMSDTAKKSKNFAPKRIALVYEDTLFGSGFDGAAEPVAKRSGYEIVASVKYAANTSEVQSEVQRIKAANPDVIMIAAYLADSLLYMKTFKQQGLEQPIVANDAGFIDPGFTRTLGHDADYVFTRDVYATNVKQRNLGVPLINELFKQRTGANLDGNTARDFTGVTVLADAINRAGSTTPDAIRRALIATDIPGTRTVMPWRGIKFDEKGQNTLGTGLVLQIQNGVYETVWPFDVATKAPMLPVPAWDKR